MNQFFVLTGGPGSGKTTLIESLQKCGYSTMAEAGRAIIQDQVAIGGQALPWVNPLLFAETMLSWDMRSYHVAEQMNGLVFFDRGVVDVLGYLRLMDLQIPKHIQIAEQKFRYNRLVFIAPPWEEIFDNDGERRQDFAEAIRTYEAVSSTYVEMGYDLVELPRSPVEDRVRFILENAKAAHSIQIEHERCSTRKN